MKTRNIIASTMLSSASSYYNWDRVSRFLEFLNTDQQRIIDDIVLAVLNFNENEKMTYDDGYDEGYEDGYVEGYSDSEEGVRPVYR